LTIVKKAMERMGGQAGLESEPGKGSRFWIELPRATVAQNREGMEAAGRNGFS
jgi:signal transduction histidine kinase